MRNLLSFVCFFSLINLNFNAQTGSITDKREGKTYKTVLMQTGRKSGPQTWLAENLVATKFKNGEPITEAKSPEEWMSLFKQGKPAWSYPDYNPEYLKYGILYNWYAIFDQRGIAPEGYRVANYEDWAIIGHYETYKDYTVTHDHGIDYNADISCYNNPPLPNYQNFMSADWREYLLDFSTCQNLGNNSSGYRLCNYKKFDDQKFVDTHDKGSSSFGKTVSGKNSTGFSALPNFQICGFGFTISDVYEARWWAIKDNKFFVGVALSTKYWLEVYHGKDNDKLKTISDCGYPVRCVKE